MNLLRDELHRIADEAPRADLAQRAVQNARSRRATRLSLTAAAVVTVLISGTAVLVNGGVRDERPIVVTPPVTVVGPLPESGVDPLESVYPDHHCPPRGEGACAGEVRWRAVTTSGTTYELPAGMGAKDMIGSPMAITPDGRRIAYYSDQRRTIEVRDLQSGRIWRAPLKITNADVSVQNFLRISPDGLHLIYTSFNGRAGAPSALVDLEKKRTTRLDHGWFPLSVGAGGSPVTLARKDKGTTRLRILGKEPVVIQDFTREFSALGPDGRTVVRIAGVIDSDAERTHRLSRTIIGVDAVTGEQGPSIPVVGIPEELYFDRLGSWASETEVTLLARSSSSARSSSTAVLYTVDVRTGKARELRTLDHGTVILPGMAQ